MKMSDDEDFKTFPFAVVEEGVIPACILLGANFMVENRLVMDFQRQVVTHKGKVLYNFSHCKYRLGLMMICASSEVNDLLASAPGGTHFHYGHTVPLDNIISLQKKDFVLQRIRNIVLSGTNTYPKRKFGWYKLFKRSLSSLLMYDNCLWYSDPNTKIAVPVINRKFLQEIVCRTHQSMAHVGEGKLKDVICSEFWHPSINQVCREVATCCPWCQKNKPGGATATPPCLKIESAAPFELVAVDLVELPRTARGYVGCFVMVDHFSKWLSVVPIKNKKAETVSAALETQVLPKLPLVPIRLLSDNGPEFRSAVFNGLLDQYNIKHVYTTPYKPSSNGAVERVNRTVIQLLKGLANSPTDWDNRLSKAVIIYNSTWHEEIKNTPGKYILQHAHVVANKPLVSKESREKWKEGNPNFVAFYRDDLVLKRIERPGRLTVHKMIEKYDGPFRVKQVFDNGVTYELLTGTGDTIRAHHSQLRKWKTPPSYMTDVVPESPNLVPGSACRECTRLNDTGMTGESGAGFVTFGGGICADSNSVCTDSDSSECDVSGKMREKSLKEFFRRSKKDDSSTVSSDSESDLDSCDLTSDLDNSSDSYTYDSTGSDSYTYDYTYDSCEFGKTYDPPTTTDLDISISPHDGVDDLVWDDMLCPQNEFKPREVLNSTSRGIAPDLEGSSSSGSLHCYDVIDESLEIIGRMNDIINGQENQNISVLEESFTPDLDPDLEMYRRSRETISETLKFLESQLAYKKRLAADFESRVESLGEEFLGFDRVEPQSRVDPIEVDEDEFLSNIDCPGTTSEGTSFDEYFDVDHEPEAQAFMFARSRNIEVLQNGSMLSGTSECSETRVQASVLSNGSVVLCSTSFTSETRVRTSALAGDSPLRNVDLNSTCPAATGGPFTRSRGRAVDLPHVMRGPLEFKKYKYD